MSAPRVLVSGVVLGQPMGGVRRHNAELLPRVAKLLEERGGSLAILEGTAKIAFALPPAIARIPSAVPLGPPLIRAALEGRALRAALAHTKHASQPFELVHTAHLPVPRSIPVPYTLAIHDLRSLDIAHTPVSRRLVSQSVIGGAVQRAALVITVSQSVRREILARFRIGEDRVRVVPNAADHFEPLPRATGEGAPLVYVGHLEPRKNLELVLRALHADASLPTLVLAGAPKGDEGERLKKLAGDLGVAERVKFTGAFEEVQLARLYARAACVVLPSRIEGFGIAALEAQRAGAPLAVARIAALREVAGESAPSFSPDDPIECARAIRSAMSAPREAIEAARQNAARFSWDASARALLDAWCAAIA